MVLKANLEAFQFFLVITGVPLELAVSDKLPFFQFFLVITSFLVLESGSWKNYFQFFLVITKTFWRQVLWRRKSLLSILFSYYGVMMGVGSAINDVLFQFFLVITSLENT